ncbi:MAG: hypothetical protein ABH864_04975 [archaeon]
MPEKEQRQILREHFLEAFVRSLVINAYDPKKDKELQESFQKDKLADMTEELKKVRAMPMRDFSRENLFPKTSGLPPPQPHEIHQFRRNFGVVEPRMHPSPGRIPIPRHSPFPLPQQPYQPTSLRPGQKPETINLGKLAGILIDPSVFSVECPGPYKNLLVNRSGSVQTSAVTLTNEEINAVMHNVSDQTRIPLTSGVFRAAIQDLVVTAVVSDFVGTRFVIQKRNPFQRF